MKSIRLTSSLALVLAAIAVAAVAACSSDDDDSSTPTPDAGVYVDGGIMQGAPPGPTGFGEGDSGTFTGAPQDSGETDFDGGTFDATSPIIGPGPGDDDAGGDAGDDAGGDAGDAAADAGDAAADAGDAGDAGHDAGDAGDAGDAAK